MPYLGWASLCLPVSDLDVSKLFYLKAGMRLVSEIPEKRAILRSGNFRMALMPFLDAPLINFRGGDVPAAYDAISAEFSEVVGSPEQYTQEQYDADADGVCWATVDPDGTEILFDTCELEQGPDYLATRSLEILEGAAEALEEMGADNKLVEKMQQDIIQPLRADVRTRARRITRP